MSVDEIETGFCQFVDEINCHLDRLAAYLTPEVMTHAPRVPPGLPGARQLVASYFTAFPDFHLAIDAVLSADGQLLARPSATSAHVRVVHGIDACGTRVTVQLSRPGDFVATSPSSSSCNWTC